MNKICGEELLAEVPPVKENPVFGEILQVNVVAPPELALLRVTVSFGQMAVVDAEKSAIGMEGTPEIIKEKGCVPFVNEPLCETVKV